MQRALCALVFLCLTAETRGDTYSGLWSTFMAYVGDVLSYALPGVRAPIIDVLFGILLVAGGSRGKRTQPLMRAIYVGFGAFALMYLWGFINHGDFRMMLFQTQWFIMMLIFALAMMSVCTKPRHFEMLGKAIVYAALYRTLMAFLFYYYFVRSGAINPPPEYMTAHGDTVLFVTAVLILLSSALEQQRSRVTMRNLFLVAIILFGIQLNGRRLAYVSLVGSLLLLFLLLPKGRVRRRIVRLSVLASPFLAAYIAVGWGRTESIFKPVQSFSSIFGKHEDVSSETRNIENYNLISTLRPNLIMGQGWGHEYLELSVAYDISQDFPQYRYVPHNSVLGIVAFTGLVGFAGIWLIFPVTAFLAARTYRTARGPLERTACAVALCEVLVFANQMYGDMGMISITSCIIMAAGIAVAGRLAVLAGGWPAKGAAARIEVHA